MPDYSKAMKAGESYAELALKALNINPAGVTAFQINFEAEGFAKIHLERILTEEEIVAIYRAQSKVFNQIEEETGARQEREEMQEIISALNSSWEKSPKH